MFHMKWIDEVIWRFFLSSRVSLTFYLCHTNHCSRMYWSTEGWSRCGLVAWTRSWSPVQSMSYLSNSVDTVVTGHGKGQREERGNVTEPSRYHGCGRLKVHSDSTNSTAWFSTPIIPTSTGTSNLFDLFDCLALHEKNTQFHWTSAIRICIHMVRPKPRLDRMATKRTIVKPVTGETLGEQPACKTSLFSSNCKCPQYDNQFSFVQTIAKVISRVRNFGISFCCTRVWLPSIREEQGKEEKQAGV